MYCPKHLVISLGILCLTLSKTTSMYFFSHYDLKKTPQQSEKCFIPAFKSNILVRKLPIDVPLSPGLRYVDKDVGSAARKDKALLMWVCFLNRKVLKTRPDFIVTGQICSIRWPDLWLISGKETEVVVFGYWVRLLIRHHWRQPIGSFLLTYKNKFTTVCFLDPLPHLPLPKTSQVCDMLCSLQRQ